MAAIGKSKRIAYLVDTLDNKRENIAKQKRIDTNRGALAGVQISKWVVYSQHQTPRALVLFLFLLVNIQAEGMILGESLPPPTRSTKTKVPRHGVQGSTRWGFATWTVSNWVIILGDLMQSVSGMLTPYITWICPAIRILRNDQITK